MAAQGNQVSTCVDSIIEVDEHVVHKIETIPESTAITDITSISELGRTYHAYSGNTYLLPNDHAE